MGTELIDCIKYLKGKLRFYTKFIIDVVTKGQVYKGDLHKNVYDVISQMKDEFRANYILQIFWHNQEKLDSVVFTYQTSTQNNNFG